MMNTGLNLNILKICRPRIHSSLFTILVISGELEVFGDTNGKPVVSIVVYRIENESTYPRYFDAELRIGVSSTRRIWQAVEILMGQKLQLNHLLK